MPLIGGNAELQRHGRQGVRRGGQRHRGQHRESCQSVTKLRNSAHRRPRTRTALILRLVARHGAAVLIGYSEINSGAACATSTGPDPRISPRHMPESKPIHRIIPKGVARSGGHALTCDSKAAAYPSFRSVAFGSAECVDRQGQMGLGAAAATGVASRGEFDPGSKLRVAARGTCRAGASSPVMFLGVRSDQWSETAAHSRASGNPAPRPKQNWNRVGPRLRGDERYSQCFQLNQTCLRVGAWPV